MGLQISELKYNNINNGLIKLNGTTVILLYQSFKKYIKIVELVTSRVNTFVCFVKYTRNRKKAKEEKLFWTSDLVVTLTLFQIVKSSSAVYVAKCI